MKSNEYISTEESKRNYDVNLDLLNAKHLLAGMDEVVTSNTEFPLIGTSSLIICHGILLYDRKNKEGMVGHATVFNYKELMSDMLTMVIERNKDFEDYEFLVIPGLKAVQDKDSELYLGMDKFLINNGFKHYSGRVEYVDSPLTHERAFMFDTRNGKFVSEQVLGDKIDYSIARRR